MDYIEARGWLTLCERELLVELARSMALLRTSEKSVTTIVNIGIEYGASIACLHHGAPQAQIIGVDIDISKSEVNDLPVYIIEADSKDYVQVWDRGIDLLFIDGDHTYLGVKADLAWVKYVNVGGYVAFHDCYDWPPSLPKTLHQVCPGVDRAVQEWVTDTMNIVPVTQVWQEALSTDTTRLFKRVE